VWMTLKARAIFHRSGDGWVSAGALAVYGGVLLLWQQAIFDNWVEVTRITVLIAGIFFVVFGERKLEEERMDVYGKGYHIRA